DQAKFDFYGRLYVRKSASVHARKRRKAPEQCSGAFLKNVRRCPTLPRGPPRSTIGAVSLSFRVRNVTGRFPDAITTETLLTYPAHNTHDKPVMPRGCGHTSRTTK